MFADNTIMQERDHAAERALFIDSLDHEKLKAEVNDLGAHPYHLPQLFPKVKGVGVRGLFRKKVALLQAVEPLFEKMLFPREEVRFATSGIFCSFAEQYMLGALSTYINRTVFIFTNFRIILLNVDSKAKPLHMKWHIPYDQIRRFKTGGLSSSMVFKLKNKKTITFSSMPACDRKPVRAFVNEMIGRAETEAFHLPHYACRDNLCPGCYAPIPKGVYECEKCGDRFIKPGKPTLMSACLPCLGDFYMGHRTLGSIELAGYVLVWVMLGAHLAEEGASALPFVALVLLLEHGLDAALTHQMAKKGLVSESRAWKAH